MSEILLLSNPSKRRKHSRKRKSARRASSRRQKRKSARRSSRRISVRARRNPVSPSLSVSGITRSIMPTVKGGVYGAVGALGNDLLFGYGKGFLPAALQSGMGRSATKILSAVIVGAAGNMIMRGRGAQFAIGAATCAIHEALKDQLAVYAPSLPLGEMDEPLSDYMEPVLGYTDSAQPVGAYMSGFGAYVGGDD
jgi:hypothetical protein